MQLLDRTRFRAGVRMVQAEGRHRARIEVVGEDTPEARLSKSFRNPARSSEQIDRCMASAHGIVQLSRFTAKASGNGGEQRPFWSVPVRITIGLCESRGTAQICLELVEQLNLDSRIWTREASVPDPSL